MKTPPLAIATLVIALSACSGGKDEAAPAPSAEATVPATAAATEVVTEEVPVESNVIPEGLQGRWGLVAADCTSTRGDAKGLLTIAPDQLRFYESVATLGEVKAQKASSVTASFAFSGEGQSWNLDVTLSSPDGGRTLVRKDTGPDAAPEPLTYTKCP